MLTYDVRFIAGFYPLLLIAFWFGGRNHPGRAVAILLIASAVFYALADPIHAPLIFSLVLINFALAVWLTRAGEAGARRWVGAGVAFNAAVLAYYKYGAGGPVAGASPAAALIQAGLPLGLSFFILKQISWLVDIRSDRKTPMGSNDLPRFALYSIFFPQMIAGPIYRYRDAAEDYASLGRDKLELSALAVGLSVFILGLAKKVLLADPIGTAANAVFEAVAAGHSPGVLEAWTGAWAYMLQLYFDFSGISDMALGIGLTFGLKLPINFFSPFKARNGSEFFDRWHISLVVFVRTYVFSPIVRRVRRSVSGSGAERTIKATAIATFVSLSLVGWWHGAKATFVFSGMAAGLASVILQLVAFRRATSGPSRPRRGSRKGWGRVMLIAAVLVFGVLFRAADLSTAAAILGGMAGLSGDPAGTALLPPLGSLGGLDAVFHLSSPVPGGALLVCLIATGIAFLGPNTVEIFNLYDHPGAPQRAPANRLAVTPVLRVQWALACGLLLAISLMRVIDGDLQGTIYARF